MTFYRREALPSLTRPLLDNTPEPSDELWARYEHDYFVSNYGLVINVKRKQLLPWRLLTKGNVSYYIVTVNRSSMVVANLIASAFELHGQPMGRNYRIEYIDGDTLNIARSNLRIVPREYTRDVSTVTTVEAYTAMLRKQAQR